MKPTSEVLRRGDYTVETIPLGMARELVAAEHYAQGSSNTATYRHGLFKTDQPLECLGAALWLPPTEPAARSVSSDPKDVMNLSRLVIDPTVPTNGASFLLGKSIRIIQRDGRFHTLLTYADEAQGHTGAIYKATNWTYLGTVKGHPRWVDAKGRQVAVKSTVNRSYAEMLTLGYTRLPASDKHKFVKYLSELPTITPIPISPDCRDGKHLACTGPAWDFTTDTETVCLCPCHQIGEAA